MAAKALCMIVRFAGWGMTVPLTGAKIDMGIGMLANAFLMVIILTVVVLDVVLSVSHAIDVQAGEMNALEGTVADVTLSFGVDVFASVDVRMLVASMTALEFISMLALIEETLLFG